MIQDMFQKHRYRGTRPHLAEVSKCLQVTLKSFARTYLIIDAIDECPETVREDLITTLRGLPSNVYILITSRPIDTIGLALDKPTRLEISAHSEGIAGFVGNRLHRSAMLRRFVSADPELGMLITNTISEESHGMYVRIFSYNTISTCLSSSPKIDIPCALFFISTIKQIAMLGRRWALTME